MADLKIEVHRSIHKISKEAWNQLSDLASPDFPFSDYAMFSSLEDSQCIGEESGWIPRYIVLSTTDDILLGALFTFVKDNSYGEYIFDWEWARAYLSYKKAYYPKLVGAIPFTPATGPRILLRHDLDADLKETVVNALVEETLKLAREEGCHSIHFLFIEKSEIPAFEARQFLIRHTFQYHWFNKGYRDFEDFLSGFKSRKRKQVLKERRSVESSGVEISFFTGKDLNADLARVMYLLYADTVTKMGGVRYLNQNFFELIFERMADRIVLFLASQDKQWVAGTLNFTKGKALYGRYWGTLSVIPALHFELCYYRTIQFAIAGELTKVEAGAQGEHKIARGFEPTLTYSAHWIQDPAFRSAIAQSVEREKIMLRSIFEDLETFLPTHAKEELL
jgi:uncharacterized protein